MEFREVEKNFKVKDIEVLNAYSFQKDGRYPFWRIFTFFKLFAEEAGEKMLLQ